MRKNSSRVSLGSSRRKENVNLIEKSGEKCDFEKRGSRYLVKNGEFMSDLQENKKVKIRVENSGSSGKLKEETLSLEGKNLEKSVLKRVGLEGSKIQEMDEYMASVEESYSSSHNVLNGKGVNLDDLLMADEKLDKFGDQENMPVMIFEDELQEDDYAFKLHDIGHKTSTGGWFVSEGESFLLAHDDGCCSFYYITNCEEKAEYKPPAGVVLNIWQDCWIIRALCADGCSGRYVVAASVGNSVHSDFCSWDFYTKQIGAYHFENKNHGGRTALSPLSNNTMHERNTLSSVMATDNQQ